MEVYIPPSHWCISYEQLLDVDKAARNLFGTVAYPSKTMRDICDNIIIETCEATGKSYALSVNPDGLPIQAFVTHSWDGCFREFVKSIEQVYQTDVDRPNLWICAFAIRQSQSKKDISVQLGESIADAPFMRALACAAEFCVIRNSNTDIYSRIWCVCELMYAKELKTHVSGPDKFSTCQTRCEDAKAYLPEDKERILEVLRENYEMEEIDALVMKYRKHETPKNFSTDPMLALLDILVGLMGVVTTIACMYALGGYDIFTTDAELEHAELEYEFFTTHDQLKTAVSAVSGAAQGDRSSCALETWFLETYGPIETWDVSRVDDFESLFVNYCGFGYNLSSWKTGGVTDMSKMFRSSTFNGEIDMWDTSSVSTMINMFDSSTFDGNIDSWDTQRVSEMSYMFKNSTFSGGDLDWNTASVTRMDGVFWDSPFDGDIRSWNTAGVTSMNYLFMNSFFDGRIAAWKTSRVRSMRGMFANSAFKGDVSMWDVSNVVNR